MMRGWKSSKGTAREEDEEKEEEEEEEEEFEDEREVESVMNWDFNDFAVTDHRLQLYCDLSLFRFQQYKSS